MIYQKGLEILFLLFFTFIVNVYCIVVQKNIHKQTISDYEGPKYFDTNNIKINRDCPGNNYITAINGCALENRDKIIICRDDYPESCIKKRGSQTIEVTTNHNEYNKFKFDYVGNDGFKLFSENSNHYIIDKFGSWVWQSNGFPVEVWDASDGRLCITFDECHSANGIPWCMYFSMAYNGDRMSSFPKGHYGWTAKIVN